MIIKFNSDDELPLNKTKEIPSMIIVFRAVFHENNKYYLQVYLDECLSELQIIWKCYIMIELTFLKELMLIRQVMIFATIGIFYQSCARVHLCFAGVSDKLLSRTHRFLPPSRCDKCLGSLWRSHICVSIFLKK